MYYTIYKACINNAYKLGNPKKAIGFIPFGFVNDKRMLSLIIGISIFFMLLWVWFIFQR